MSQERYWVPHQSAVFLPGWIIKTQDDGSVVYQTEEDTVTLTKDKAENLDKILDDNSLLGVNDICTLSSVTKAALLHNVRVRYFKNDIYTNVSRILIAVNPFKKMKDIYSNEYVDRYKTAKDPATLPPHIFGISADGITALTMAGKSQAVLISGESGAGKTESTKLVLLYISEVLQSSESGFEDKILEINPILEAFGNAKTPRNNNSSRFGKWIEVQLNAVNMTLTGATVTDYLLEVTRVCSQGPGDRNYHIFYQLMLESEDGHDAYHLLGKKFAYFGSNPMKVDEIDDADNMKQLRRAFAALSFGDVEQENIFRIAAGILHLGNVSFKEKPGDENSSVVDDEAPLIAAAKIFECDAEKLSECMRFKKLVVGKEITQATQNATMARQTRDSLAKCIYGRMFSWLVVRCNEVLGSELHLTAGKEAASPFIGVLDIAGFESFEINMLEQLFINLSNEKLQQFFNSTVFKSELADYTAEGIDVGSIDFADNADVLALIEGKGGLLTMLDDATLGIKQTDSQYTDKVSLAHAKHARFIKSKFSGTNTFGVRHFAGDVMYSTVCFLEKNHSNLPMEVAELLKSSVSPILQALGEEQQAPPPDAARRGTVVAINKKATVASNFRKSLAQLIDKLSTAEAHFVRCVKPNSVKKPDIFDSAMVVDQLRLSGIMDAVKIRKAGFPIRVPCVEFVKRYLIILPKAMKSKILTEAGSLKSTSPTPETDCKKAAEGLLSVMPNILGPKVSTSDFAVGKTKVFMKDGLNRLLEQSRRLALAGPALAIQCAYRGSRIRNGMKIVFHLYKQIQEKLDAAGQSGPLHKKAEKHVSALEKLRRPTMLEDSVTTLDTLLSQAEALPIILPTLTRAYKARKRIVAEAGVARLMAESIESFDVSSMQALLARATALKMTGELMDRVQTRFESVQAQTPHRAALLNAAGDKLEDIELAVEAARKAGLDKADAWVLPNGHQSFEAAVARVAELVEERRVLEEAKRKAAEELAAAEAAERARLEEEHRLAEEAQKKAEEERRAAEAAEVQRRADAIKALKEQLELAASEYDAPQLEKCFRDADEMGLPQSDHAEAHELFMHLQDGEWCQTKLNEMRSKKGETAALMAISNISAQIGALGLTVEPMEEMHEVAISILANAADKEESGNAESNEAEMRLAAKCFENVQNFSRLQSPLAFEASQTRVRVRTRGETFCAEVQDEPPTEAAMLKFSPERIPAALTKLSPADEQIALRNFGNLQRCMGEKTAAYIGDKEEPIIKVALKSEALCDEVYLQVIKQLTQNPSTDSETNGWALFLRLAAEALPSREMSEFVYAFLSQTKAMPAKERCHTAETSGEVKDESFQATKRKTLSRNASAVAEMRMIGYETNRAAFENRRRQLASEVFDQFEETRSEKKARQTRKRATVKSEQMLLSVHTEDGLHRDIKVKPTMTLGELHERMLKVLSIRNGDAFEFFLDSDDGAPLLKLLPPDMKVQAVADETEDVGKLVFGRVHLALNEDLPVDDFPHARLSFFHATKQFLKYSLPFSSMVANLPSDLKTEEDGIATIAAALLAAHKAIFPKLRKGTGHAKYNEKVEKLQAAINNGLVDTGMLEQYIPEQELAKRDRKEWGQLVLKALELSEAATGGAMDHDGASLVTQNRAVSLMQSWLPDFHAYVWSPVTLASELQEFKWTDSGSFSMRLPCPPPKENYPLGSGEYWLMVTSAGMELRPHDANEKAIVLGWQRAPLSQCLIGWQDLSDTVLRVAFLIWQPELSKHKSMQAAITVPNNSARAITVLLMKIFAHQ